MRFQEEDETVIFYKGPPPQPVTLHRGPLGPPWEQVSTHYITWLFSFWIWRRWCLKFAWFWPFGALPLAPMGATLIKKNIFIFWHNIQRVPEKRKPINQVNFSENCNDLSEKDYIVTKFNLSSFFWHQLQDVLAMHGQARTISNGDVKIDLRRIWTN